MFRVPTTEEQRSSVAATLSKFKAVNINFNLDSVGGDTDQQEIGLYPGYEYTFAAVVEIFPTYVQDWTENIIDIKVEQLGLSSIMRTSQFPTKRPLKLTVMTSTSCRGGLQR